MSNISKLFVGTLIASFSSIVLAKPLAVPVPVNSTVALIVLTVVLGVFGARILHKSKKL